MTKEVLDEFELPKENQKIVRIVAGRGNNLHQVSSMPYDLTLVLINKVLNWCIDEQKYDTHGHK